jgi:hypothetical protein
MEIILHSLPPSRITAIRFIKEDMDITKPHPPHNVDRKEYKVIIYRNIGHHKMGIIWIRESSLSDWCPIHKRSF